MEKMGLLSSQGFTVAGQERRDTSNPKENSDWMQEKITDSEDGNTLEKVVQKSENLLLEISKSQLDRTLDNFC